MAIEPGDAEFRSMLNDASKRRAKDELHELNDKDRALAVQTFRQWILQQPWLRTPTDFEFLLRFLRARKFSQLGARQTIENYWKCKTQNPEWFRDVDPADPIIQDILRTGCFLCPKRYDREGRRLMIQNMGLLTYSQMKTWGARNIFRALLLLYDWANTDENAQTNGVQILVDGDFPVEFVKMLMESGNHAKLIQYALRALPVRLKGIHAYNVSSVFDMVLTVMKPFLSLKALDRMTLHGKNMANVYKKIDFSCLPDDYLPDDYKGPSAGQREQIIDEMISDMMSPEFREYITRLSSDRYGVDVRKQTEREQVPVASFRKLNID